MKWFKVHGLELLTGSRFQSMTDNEKGMWLTAMAWASVNNIPGQIPVKSLPFRGKKLEKFRQIVCKKFNFFKEENEIFHVVDWHNFQSDYELYQKGKSKSSKKLRNKFVIDIEEEVDIDIKKKNKQKKNFIKPTMEELIAYFIERGGDKNEAERFFDFYESKGWKVGKEPMKDWKAAVRNWMRGKTSKPTGAAKAGVPGKDKDYGPSGVRKL